MRNDAHPATETARRSTAEFSIHPPPPRQADLTLSEARVVDARLRDYRDQQRLGRLLRKRALLTLGTTLCVCLTVFLGLTAAVLLYQDHNFVQLGLPGWVLLAAVLAACLGAGFFSSKVERITQQLKAEFGEPPWFFV